MKQPPSQDKMKDASPASTPKIREIKKGHQRRSSAPSLPSKYLNISTSIVSNADTEDRAVVEEKTNNKRLMSRNFANTHFTANASDNCNDASISDLSNVASLQTLAKATMSSLGREVKPQDEETEDEEEAGEDSRTKKEKSRSSKRKDTRRRRQTLAVSTKQGEKEEDDDQDKKNRRKIRSKSKSFDMDNKPETQEGSRRRSRSQTKTLGANGDIQKRSKDRSESRSSPRQQSTSSQKQTLKGEKDGKSKREGRKGRKSSSLPPNGSIDAFNKERKDGEAKDGDITCGDAAEPKRFGRESKSRRGARTSRRSTTDEANNEVNEEGKPGREEATSRHMRGSRLSQRRRSTATLGHGSKEENDNEDQEEEADKPTTAKGRMRRSKSHEMFAKKKQIRKTKSMDFETEVDGDDDAVVANDKAETSPARRVRSITSRRAATTPGGTPTNRRVTRRRASLTQTVTEAIAEANASEGATEATSSVTNIPTATRRPTRRSRTPGQSSGSNTPTAVHNRSRGRRTSSAVGGHQLRQALQQEVNATPAVLKDLDDEDSVKPDDEAETQPVRDNIEKPEVSALPAEDTDMETDASEQAAITTRLPSAYNQQDRSRMDGAALDSVDAYSLRPRTAGDRLSSSSHHGKSSSTGVLPSGTGELLSSSYHGPRSSSSGTLSTLSNHGRGKATSRLSNSRHNEPLSMPSSSSHGRGRTSSRLSSSRHEGSLPSSSDHGGIGSQIVSRIGQALSSASDHTGQRKSWFPFQKQSDPLAMPTSSGHGPSKRATSPSRRAAMQQRGGATNSTTERMHASSSGFGDLMNASASNGFVLPMVQGANANGIRGGGRRNSLPTKPKQKKVSIVLPRKEKFDDLDDDSDDDFAY